MHAFTLPAINKMTLRLKNATGAEKTRESDSLPTHRTRWLTHYCQTGTFPPAVPKFWF